MRHIGRLRRKRLNAGFTITGLGVVLAGVALIVIGGAAPIATGSPASMGKGRSAPSTTQPAPPIPGTIPAPPGSTGVPSGPTVQVEQADGTAFLTPVTQTTSTSGAPQHSYQQPVSHLRPRDTNPGFLYCGTGNTSAILFLAGDTLDSCFIGAPTTWTDVDYAKHIYILLNSTGYRVWMHQTPGGSGWADCFDHGQAFVTGGRDEVPGSIYVSTNSEECPSYPDDSTPFCTADLVPMAVALGENLDVCYQATGTYSGTALSLPILAMENGTNYRVWLHQNADNSGWSDCFDTNNVYLFDDDRDANPGNLQLTTASDPC